MSLIRAYGAAGRPTMGPPPSAPPHLPRGSVKTDTVGPRLPGSLMPNANQPLQLQPPRLSAEPDIVPSPFTEPMARELLGRRQLEPNHIYVVALDVNNTGAASAHRLKGTDFVFATDSQGTLRYYDSFRSSTQPTATNPSDWWPDVDPTYRFPYVRDGDYPLGTQIYGSTAGFIIGARADSPLPAYRDDNMDGEIDGTERDSPTTADLIRLHRSELGSSGCHLIATREWPRFRKLIERLAAEGRDATYVFQRSDPKNLSAGLGVSTRQFTSPQNLHFPAISEPPRR